MFFTFRFHNKTVKELRKNQGYTANELAQKLKIKPSIIHRVDDTPQTCPNRCIPNCSLFYAVTRLIRLRGYRKLSDLNQQRIQASFVSLLNSGYGPGGM